jgi:hypothetical protein
MQHVQKRYFEDVKKHREKMFSLRLLNICQPSIMGKRRSIHVTLFLIFLGYFPYGKQVYLSLAVPFFALVVVNRRRQPAVVELDLIIINKWHTFLLLYWFIYVYNDPAHCNKNPIYVFPEKELHGLSPQFPLSCVCE